MPRTRKQPLSVQFAKHRRPNGRRYSDTAKVVAQEARERGYTVAEIAEAAGISSNTVRAWLSTSKIPPLQELMLAEAASSQPQRLVIHLPSGITIEVA